MLKNPSKLLLLSRCFSKKSAILLSVILLLCLTGLLITTYTQLLETVSSSLKGINYILVRKSSSIQRGDIVSIQGHTVKYVGEKLLAKRVLGLPGDRILQDEGKIILITSEFDPQLLKYLNLQSKGSEFEVSEGVEDTDDHDGYDDKNTDTEDFSSEEFDPELLQILSSHPFGIEIFPLLKQTKEGNPLTPLSVKRISEGNNTEKIIPEGIIPKGIIPPGYVFVAGDNPHSFDSRYEEFGLVPMEKIWGKAVVWW